MQLHVDVMLCQSVGQAVGAGMMLTFSVASEACRRGLLAFLRKEISSVRRGLTWGARESCSGDCAIFARAFTAGRRVTSFFKRSKRICREAASS